MNISFTGIDYLQIGKSRSPKSHIGLYPSVTGEIKQGEISTNEYKVQVTLTDDCFGKDYTEMLMAMSKAEKGLNTTYLSNPNRIEIHMTKHDVLDDDIFKDYSFSTFKVNGSDVPITGLKTLPLYTVMAKLTREILKQFNLNENQKEVINLVNQSIQTEAEKFIDAYI